MDPIEIMKRPAPYASGHENAPAAAQLRAKRLCWEYNRTAPDEAERRGEILRELLGTCDPLTFIEPGVPCRVLRPITERDRIAPEDILF